MTDPIATVVDLLDFAGEFPQDPERALARLLLLVLDPDACLDRVAFLKALASTAEPVRPVVDDHGPALALLCEEGILAAYKKGSLTPERVAQLARLTCDPEALWTAHRRLLDVAAPGPRQEGTTSLRAETRMDNLSSLAQAGQRELVAERFGPLVPFFLRHVGLPEQEAEAFLDFLREHLGEVGRQRRRFRDLLPDWLAGFAEVRQQQARPLRAEDIGPLVEHAAVASVLSRAEEDEPKWVKELRSLAGSVRTCGELFRLELPGHLAEQPAAGSYLFALAREIKTRHDELARELELI